MRTNRLIITAVTAALVAAIVVGSSTGSTRSASAYHSVVVATLSPKTEVGKKGSPKARGSARLSLKMSQGKVCWRLSVSGLDRTDKKLSAYVHKARPGKTGPPVIPLGSRYATKGCVSGVGKKTLKAIGTSPKAYYVNVYTKKFLRGAVRGQLRVG